MSSQTLVLILLLLPALMIVGCRDEPVELTLDDLTPGERTYIERFVVLERVRAVSFADPQAAVALYDSLAAAWGDTTAVSIIAGLPEAPQRLSAIHVLLEHLLEAEADSLLLAPRPDRLGAPLPDLPTADAESAAG